jgi:hypothetical protein
MERDEKILVESVWVDVYEVDFERGELDHVNSFDIDIPNIYTYNSIDEMMDVLLVVFGYDLSEVGYEIFEGKLVTSFIVDENNEKPADYKLEEWENGERTLYTAHVRVRASRIVKRPLF